METASGGHRSASGLAFRCEEAIEDGVPSRQEVLQLPPLSDDSLLVLHREGGCARGSLEETVSISVARQGYESTVAVLTYFQQRMLEAVRESPSTAESSIR